MTTADFTEFCIAEIEEDNQAWVEEQLVAARTAITAGKGTVAVLTGGSVNGKNVTREIVLNPAQMAKACREALRSAGADGVISTSLDFSELCS